MAAVIPLIWTSFYPTGLFLPWLLVSSDIKTVSLSLKWKEKVNYQNSFTQYSWSLFPNKFDICLFILAYKIFAQKELLKFKPSL